MKISKYVRLGFLVAVSLFILGWGINFLNNKDIFNKSNEYFVVYTRVDGLEKSNKVMLRGFEIGKVADIEFKDSRNEELLVTLNINSDIDIPFDSKAKITSADIMGTRIINLVLGESPQFYESGDTLHSEIEEDLQGQISRQVLPIKEKAEELLASIDTAVTTLNIILNRDARQDLKQSFANINKSLQNVEDITEDVRLIVERRKGNIENTLVNVDSITTSLKNNSKSFEHTLDNLSAFSDSLSSISLNQTVANLEAATDEINNLVKQAGDEESTLGLLLNDDELYYRVNDLTTNLDELAKDLRYNPSRYLSLSLLDFSKDLYVNPDISSESKNIKFYVTLYISEIPLDINGPSFKNIDNVKDIILKGEHHYYTTETFFYSEALKELAIVQESIPSATITAVRKGRKMKLEKALKILAD